MNILLLGSYGPSLINFRGPLISALIAKGHQVHAGAPDITADIAEKLQRLGAQVHQTPMQRTGMNPLRDVAYFRDLRRVMRQAGAEMVITYTIKPNIWGAFAAASLGIPSAAMVTGLGYAFTDAGQTGLKARLVRKVAVALYRQATNRNYRVIFQNTDDRDDFIGAGALSDPGKVALVNGSGVDLNEFAPAALPDAPVFLMISRLLKNKGVREYGEAVVRLKQELPDVACRLVGYMDEGPDGIDAADLERWQAAGLEYLGPKSDVRPEIAAASVYVLPSYREGTPRTVLEAMAMGRPVITSNAPGCRATVQDGHNGMLVPVQDPVALSTAMKVLATDDQRRREMADAALRVAEEKYDVNKVNAALINHLGL